MFSHDTLKDLIAIACESGKLFSTSVGNCVALREVMAVADRAQRADLVLVTKMPFPYVRIVEVKTRVEDVWDAISYLKWFRDHGFANYYFVALPEEEIRKLSLSFYDEFRKENIGLLSIRIPKEVTLLVGRIEASVSIVIKPEFRPRKRDWEDLYQKLERIGKTKLIERLRNTVGKSPLG